MASTGKRVFFSKGAPLTLPGMTSTKGHSDQSRLAIQVPSFHRSFYQGSAAASPNVFQTFIRVKTSQSDAAAQRTLSETQRPEATASRLKSSVIPSPPGDSR